MVSLPPGVNPLTTAVVNCAHVRDSNTGRVTPSVIEAYSVMGVPPPMATEPATSEVAVTVPLTVWFPVKVLLPVVTAAPGSLTVSLSVVELGAKAAVSGVNWAVMVLTPIPIASASSSVSGMLPPQPIGPLAKTSEPFEIVTVPDRRKLELELGVTVAVRLQNLLRWRDSGRRLGWSWLWWLAH